MTANTLPNNVPFFFIVFPLINTQIGAGYDTLRVPPLPPSARSRINGYGEAILPASVGVADQVPRAGLRFICSTCGSPISRSSPRRRGRPFMEWLHIMGHFGKAINGVWSRKPASWARDRKPALTKTRWLLLERSSPEPHRGVRLADAVPPAQRAELPAARRTSSSSGATARPIGPGASSTDGAYRHDAMKIRRYKRVARMQGP